LYLILDDSSTFKWTWLQLLTDSEKVIKRYGRGSLSTTVVNQAAKRRLGPAGFQPHALVFAYKYNGSKFLARQQMGYGNGERKTRF
jgi:hypothetical protein